jgi:predicted DNA-binding transcriptional regulator AlpA
MRTQTLVPLKKVIHDLGVSRTTMWRAMRCNIEGFPAPVVIRRRVHWRNADIEQLEAALLCYEGRCAFDRQQLRRRLLAMKSAQRGRSNSKRKRFTAQQGDLFDAMSPSQQGS